MTDSEQFDADQLAFWNGQGGHTWVSRQAHTDITLRTEDIRCVSVRSDNAQFCQTAKQPPRRAGEGSGDELLLQGDRARLE
jgi:hypothetical protein